MVNEIYSPDIQYEINKEEENEYLHDVARNIIRYLNKNFTGRYTVSITKGDWNISIKIYYLEQQDSLLLFLLWNHYKKKKLIDIIFNWTNPQEICKIKVYRACDMHIARRLVKYMKTKGYDTSSLFHIEKNFR